MAKKKNYWYVLVFTNEGPRFVTKINYGDKTAEWNVDEKPIEFSAETAKDLAIGLTLNFHLAYPVCSPYEVENHGYNYEFGHFEWVSDKT